MSNGHSVTPESLEALASCDRDQLRERVHTYFRQRREVGCIDDEISQELGLGHNSVAPRRNELEDAGLVTKLFDSNGQRVRRKTRQGCFAGVYIAVEFAPYPTNSCTMVHEPPISRLPTPASRVANKSLFGEVAPKPAYPD
jgi:DNA-binding transcriptional ArsR family regulator